MTLGEQLIDELRTELLTLMEAAVDGLVAKARTKLELIEQEAEEHKAKGHDCSARVLGPRACPPRAHLRVVGGGNLRSSSRPLSWAVVG